MKPPNSTTNRDLKDRYYQIYRDGEETYFSKFVDGVNTGGAQRCS